MSAGVASSESILEVRGVRCSSAGQQVVEDVTFSVPATGITAVLPDQPELAVLCSTDPVAPGDSVSCSVSDRSLTQDDIESGAVEFAEVASGTAPDGAVVTADDAITVALGARSGLFLEGVWTPSDGDPVRPGDTIASTFRVTNTSNLIVRSPAVESRRSGAVVCVAQQLAPGEETACATEGSHAVTDRDVLSGTIGFTAVATGTVGRADSSAIRSGAVEVVSNEVGAEFRVVPPAAAAALAYTGVELTKVVGLAVGAAGIGIVLLFLVWRRRRSAV